MKLRHTAPDWPLMIAQLLHAGLTYDEMSSRIGFAACRRTIQYYQRGVQPVYHRGEPLIDLWCVVLVKERTEVPKIPVRKPYRVPYSVQKEREVVVPSFPVPTKRSKKAGVEA